MIPDLPKFGMVLPGSIASMAILCFACLFVSPPPPQFSRIQVSTNIDVVFFSLNCLFKVFSTPSHVGLLLRVLPCYDQDEMGTSPAPWLIGRAMQLALSNKKWEKWYKVYPDTRTITRSCFSSLPSVCSWEQSRDWGSCFCWTNKHGKELKPSHQSFVMCMGKQPSLQVSWDLGLVCYQV